MIVANTHLATLCRMAVQVETYKAKIVRDVALSSLKFTAQSFGFSFEHFEKTGIWKLYTEIETENVKRYTVNGKRETVETVSIETETEAVKSGGTRLERTFEAETAKETACLECGKRFETARKTKRFCVDKCKNAYNNKRRKNE
jgi:hypothetical protein